MFKQLIKLLGFVRCNICGILYHKQQCEYINLTDDGKIIYKDYVCVNCKRFIKDIIE